MLPDINSSKTPLDTSIVLATNSYNYYNIKCKGLTRLGTLTGATRQRSRQSALGNGRLTELNPTGSPQKTSSDQFTFDPTITKPRSNTVCIKSEKLRSNPQLLPLARMNLMGQKKSLPHLQSSEKQKQSPPRRCCNNAKSIPKGQNARDLTSILEQKLFKQIRDDDTEERMQLIKLRGKDKHANYTSSGLEDPEKWGTSAKQVTRGFNTFGRNLKKFKQEHKIQEYSRDELQRLVLSDVKLYIPSRVQYVRDYTKEIVRELLLQSNSGVKYREPCS